MRFLDANIFVYAYYKPGRKLTQEELQMKTSAKEIVDRIDRQSEEIVTTVIHLSEVANILKHAMATDELAEVVLGLLMLDSVKVLDVTRDDYLAAAEIGRDLGLDPNDALAVRAMRSEDVREIYSFDSDFDKVSDITRLP